MASTNEQQAMRFLVLHRAGHVDGGAPPLAAGALACARLQPTSAGVRVAFVDGVARVDDRPLDAPGTIVGFSLVEAPSLVAAIDAVAREATVGEVEIRPAGCPGGVEGFVAAGGDASLPRFALLLRANDAVEAGVAPAPERLEAMTRRNREGVRAGVLLAGEGLQPSAAGARVHFAGGRASVTDGPFAEVKELVAGMWLMQGRSIDDAIAWVRAYPYPFDDAVVEIRPLRP